MRFTLHDFTSKTFHVGILKPYMRVHASSMHMHAYNMRILKVPTGFSLTKTSFKIKIYQIDP